MKLTWGWLYKASASFWLVYLLTKDSQKHHRRDAIWWSSQFDTSLSSSCIKNVGVMKLNICRLGCIKLVCKKSWQSTCIKPIDNLQQTCCHQVGASDANASWYRFNDDSKACNKPAADLLELGCYCWVMNRWPIALTRKTLKITFCTYLFCATNVA